MKITLFMKRYEIIYVCDLIVGRFISKSDWCLSPSD